MRAVVSIALAVLALTAPTVALAELQIGAPCTPAHDRRYQNHGYVCVKTGGRYRLARIVAAPARPDQPGPGRTVTRLHPK